MLAESLPAVTSIEFPLRVNDTSKAVSMVGGPKAVAHATATAGEQLHLSLRPDDPFDHKIASGIVDIQNIVMEIELPRDVYEAANKNVREALAVAGDRARIRPAFLASSNHRFRDMSDFQYFTGESKFTTTLKQSVLAGDLDAMKGVSLNTATQQTLLPPPRFSLQTQPFSYGYKQTPSVVIVDNGNGAPKLVSKAPRPRLISSILIWGDPVPAGPPAELEATPRPQVNKCIELITVLFKKRPSYTRRALEALLPVDMRRYLRYALPYVAYFYKSGPWRGAYIAYGIDVTKDKSMAPYQVEHFRVSDTEPTGDDTDDSPRDSAAFTFNGIVMPASPMLQLCDIKEKFLASYIANCALRDEVDASDGWYTSESLGTIQRVLRAELLAASENKGFDEKLVRSLIQGSR